MIESVAPRIMEFFEYSKGTMNSKHQSEKGTQQSKNCFAETLNKIEHVRDIVDGDISLPQICVVGDQSSGKSTLLEAISNIKFPTGARICTRCPIIVSLERSDVNIFKVNGKSVQKEDLESEIRSAQKSLFDHLPPHTKVSNEAIKITASAPDNVPLVLVDLPGIIHNGEEKEVVDSMIRHFIEPKETLILIVREANSEDELQMALSIVKEPGFDPQLDRTIQVFTKGDNFSSPDNMMRVARSLERTENKVNGDHLVACRPDGTKEVRSDLESLHSNEMFKLRKNVGVETLKNKRLPYLLSECIKTNLPTLKEKLFQKLGEARKELRVLGNSPLDEREILKRIREKMESNRRDLEYKISRCFEVFHENIREKMTKSFDQNWTNEIYDKCRNIFLPIFFQGQEAFQECVSALAQSTKEDVDLLVEEIAKNLSDSGNMLELSKEISEELLDVINNSWKRMVEEVYHQMCDFMHEIVVKDASEYNTVNHYLTANFVKCSIFPEEVMDEFIDSINIADYGQQECKNEEQFKVILKAKLKSQVDAYVDTRAHQSLQEHQKKQLYDAVKSYAKVAYKVYADNTFATIKRIAFMKRAKWISTFERDEHIREKAKEPKSITQKREKAKVTIEKMEVSLKILYGL